MALIKVGSINSFAVETSKIVKKQKPFLNGINTFSTMSEVSKDIPPDSFEFVTSSEKRGVGLKSIQLTEGFEGFLQKFLDPNNELYFIAWAWDLSGQNIFQYPGKNVSEQDVQIPIKVGKIREFIGQGINLFPKQMVKGGISIRIQLWESDKKTRNFGKVMSETADAIKKSKLNNLLSLISLTTGVAGATVTMIKEASFELAKVIGIILQANGDDYVDFFEGYYAADQNWDLGDDPYEGNSAILTLNKY